jgi:glycosyltransferase involved in cell wall biosynthesis
MRASNAPLVSIILPTFDRLRFLRPAVDSVLAQSFIDWELLIADDGSGADTRQYLRTLERDARITLIWLTHSGTPAIVRNAALGRACGEYVAFMDSDDLWTPVKLERQLEALRARRGCRWSYTAFSQIDERDLPLPEEARRRWVPHQGFIFERLTIGEVSIRTPSVLATRELIMQAGGFDETLRSAEDLDLWLRLALDSEVALVDEPLLLVRRHDENHSRAWQSAFSGRDHALHKLQARVDARRRGLLRRERVGNAIKLALTHASLGEHAGAVRALWCSARYAWWYPRWWLAGARTLLRAPLPKRLMDVYRHSSRSA